MKKTNIKYSPQEEAMLKELYSDMQNSNISILLGRSVNSIANKASRLRLNKSKLHLHKIAAMPNKGKYKSGHVPHNKGRRQRDWMSMAALSKCTAARVHRRKNTQGYLAKGVLIKRIDGKLRNVARHIWEITFGAIPDGYVVHHLDGNLRNVSIENLELRRRGWNLGYDSVAVKQSIASRRAKAQRCNYQGKSITECRSYDTDCMPNPMEFIIKQQKL